MREGKRAMAGELFLGARPRKEAVGAQGLGIRTQLTFCSTVVEAWLAKASKYCPVVAISKRRSSW
jgi:hypothetical protein